MEIQWSMFSSDDCKNIYSFQLKISGTEWAFQYGKLHNTIYIFYTNIYKKIYLYYYLKKVN